VALRFALTLLTSTQRHSERNESLFQWHFWQTNSLREETSILGTENEIKQYDRPISQFWEKPTEAKKYKKEIQSFHPEPNSHFYDKLKYETIYEVSWLQLHLT
jgi:hypothetical protein